MNRMHLRALSAACAAILSCALSSPSQAAGDVSAEELQRGEAAIEQDLDAAVAPRGTSREEVRRRMEFGYYASIDVEALREKFADRWAGAYLVHEDGESRLVVRLKGVSRSGDEVTSQAAEATVPIEIVEGVEMTESEVAVRIEERLERIRSAFPTFQGHYVDDKTSEVVVLIARPDLFESGVSELDRSTAEQRLGLLLSGIVELPARVTVMPAGFSPMAQGSGDVLYSGGFCTGGFTVRRIVDGATGVSTAAHCGNQPLSYANLDGTNSQLTFAAEWNDGTYDFQWHFSSTPPEAAFYVSAPPAAEKRFVEGVRRQSSTLKDDIICHYGASSGMSCGSVEESAFASPSGCGPQQAMPCSATWVLMKSTEGQAPLRCLPGDSGGPYFIWNVAVGIHSQGVESTDASDPKCFIAFYMSVDRLPNLGLEVLRVVPKPKPRPVATAAIN